ncbi:helix-turn-helix domain-containing protein [Nocardia sp. NPDC052278]|uniref:helix-turn-helix domain-containing protein n=1 Tax=unclassified Nocardia TaxID=2637762 RepID=UPI0036C5C27B
MNHVANSPPSAVAKVVLVLEALPTCRGISEISRATGLSTSTVHRILQELAASAGSGSTRITDICPVCGCCRWRGSRPA